MAAYHGSRCIADIRCASLVTFPQPCITLQPIHRAHVKQAVDSQVRQGGCVNAGPSRSAPCYLPPSLRVTAGWLRVRHLRLWSSACCPSERPPRDRKPRLPLLCQTRTQCASQRPRHASAQHSTCTTAAWRRTCATGYPLFATTTFVCFQGGPCDTNSCSSDCVTSTP